MALEDTSPEPPRRGQPWRYWIHFVNASGQRITGLTGLSVSLRLDEGSSASLTNTPAEMGSTGLVPLDFLNAETEADILHLTASVTNAGAIAIARSIPTSTGQLDVIESHVEATREIVTDLATDAVDIKGKLTEVRGDVDGLVESVAVLGTDLTSALTGLESLATAVAAIGTAVSSILTRVQTTGVVLAAGSITDAATHASFITEMQAALPGGGGGGGGGEVTICFCLNADALLPGDVFRITSGDAFHLKVRLLDSDGRHLTLPEDAEVSFTLRKVGESEPVIDNQECELVFPSYGDVWYEFTGTEFDPGAYIGQFLYAGMHFPIGRTIPFEVVEAA